MIVEFVLVPKMSSPSPPKQYGDDHPRVNFAVEHQFQKYVHPERRNDHHTLPQSVTLFQCGIHPLKKRLACLDRPQD
jgi:hypothetical protein